MAAHKSFLLKMFGVIFFSLESIDEDLFGLAQTVIESIAIYLDIKSTKIQRRSRGLSIETTNSFQIFGRKKQIDILFSKIFSFD